jgi:hypothetical protein
MDLRTFLREVTRREGLGRGRGKWEEAEGAGGKGEEGIFSGGGEEAGIHSGISSPVSRDDDVLAEPDGET